MVAGLTFNPYKLSNAPGSFNVQSDGYIQGMALPDPAARYALAGGVLSDDETIPIWGGVAINETTNPVTSGPSGGQTGGLISRATQVADPTDPDPGDLTGFSAFDQNFAAVNSPQSPVPLIGSGGQVNFYRLGSGIRIPLPCDPALVNLENNGINQLVSWDFVNQLLVPYEASSFTISSGTYNNTTGDVVLTLSAPANFSAGDAVIISALTGTGNFALLNGTYTATAVSGSTVTYNPGAGIGASTITGGTLTLGSGAASILPVRVLQVQIGNSMTVAYDPDTGFATWNRTGSVAVVLL